jgi:hypothetical protein
MAALHLDEATRRRDRIPIGQEQDRPRPLGHPRRNAWPPQQGLQFFSLIGGYRNDPLPTMRSHPNLLVQDSLVFASLVWES